MKDIYDTYGITATAGVGTNLYLTKIALDITAKHVDTHIGYLDEEKYKNELWHHQPLTDFWQVGRGISKRLNDLGLKDMYDIAHCNEKILYKEFGINARLLIDHSKGIEPVTIKEIKKYKPKSNSISNGQILFKNYNYEDARKVLIEMIYNSCLELVKKNICTTSVNFYICYSKNEIPLSISRKIIQPSNNNKEISKIILNDYDKNINKNALVRKISISFGNLQEKKYEQLDLFSDMNDNKKEEKIERVMNDIKDKYGLDSLLIGRSLDEKATQRKRNKLIGGHNAE